MNDVVTNTNQAKELVRQILRTDIRARNDDKYLVVEYWKKMGVKVLLTHKEYTVHFNDPSELPNPASVIRARAQIQNKEGQFLPTDPQVCIARRINEDLLTKYYAETQNWLYEYKDLKYKGVYS